MWLNFLKSRHQDYASAKVFQCHSTQQKQLPFLDPRSAHDVWDNLSSRGHIRCLHHHNLTSLT